MLSTNKKALAQMVLEISGSTSLENSRANIFDLYLIRRY
ncbi:hypothetical protein Ple7327_1396 [Pleurocapsa sp. PCC 7327]|nr:hypothetical protein Ple7327_1396 [Pleurocapsa sp. PCC 7327]